MKSWRVDVMTYGDAGVYSSNRMRFATRDEAADYAEDLVGRWLAVIDWRIVETPDLVTARWTDAGLDHIVYDMQLEEK